MPLYSPHTSTFRTELASSSGDDHRGTTSPPRSHQLYQPEDLHRRSVVPLQHRLVVWVLRRFGSVHRHFVDVPGQRDVLDG